ALRGDSIGLSLGLDGFRAGRGEQCHGDRDKFAANLCPNPRVPKKNVPSSGTGGLRNDCSRKIGVGASGNGGSAQPHKFASFKEALANRGGQFSGRRASCTQTYLVDLAEDVPSLTIENPKVEEYFKNLSQDAMIGGFN
ncbi:hypothetical protein KI387_025339, partial [Taxus chinensis]